VRANELPLEGIRVLTFSTAFAGPTTSRYLADFGAEVIKVESKRRPDNTRGAGGPYREPSGATTAPGFQHFNRNKLDIAIDLSQEAGQALMRRLVSASDVLMNNFSRRVLRGWGLDYEHLRELRPDIIMLDMQGLGQTGPWSEYVTFGATVQSFAGLTSIWGYSHGGYADYIAMEHAVTALLAAIIERYDHGRGIHIDLAQTETAAAMLGTFFLDYAVNGRIATSEGAQGRPGAPSGCFRCLGDDAWCVIDVNNDDEWRRLVAAIGSPAWASDARFTSVAGRREAAADLAQALEGWTRERTPAEVETILQAHGVAAGWVRSPSEVFADPHLEARAFYETIEHPVLGSGQFAGFTARLSDTPGRVQRPAPMLGEHNDYVFGELLGLSTAEVERLTEEGILS
jgi:crotonobetainyl-CoA:carnitine CoA-transferase CaiB-like acyl-CoA transferase